MITWGPCGHPLRVANPVVASLACRVCWLLALPANIGTTRAYRRSDGQPNPAHVEIDNAWTAYVGDIEIGSHRTVEQMRAIELNSRRACNRGTRFETEEGLAIVLRDAADRRYHGAVGDVQRAIDFICPPQSRRPTWLINWVLAQRQKQLVDNPLAKIDAGLTDVDREQLYGTFGIEER